MNNFEIGSLAPDDSQLKTSTEIVFTYEYLTTANPFDIDTTVVPGTEDIEYNSMLAVIYGIGAFLIIFVIYSFCYRFWMPIESDELYERAQREDRARIAREALEQAREARRLQSQQSSTNPPAPVTDSTAQVTESNLNADTNSENRVIRDDIKGAVIEATTDDIQGAGIGATTDDIQGAGIEASSVVSNLTTTEEKFFSKTFLKQLCKNAIPKYVIESYQTFFRTPENCEAENQEEFHYQEPFCIVEKPEETQFRTQVVKKENLGARPKIKKQTETYQKTYEGNDDTQPLKTNNDQSSGGGQSKSSPTSPNIVRRRYSTYKDSPRRLSS